MASGFASLLREAQASNIVLDTTTLEFLLRRKLESLADRFAAQPANLLRLNDLLRALKIARQMPFAVNLWSAQNQVYAIQHNLYQANGKAAEKGDKTAAEWVESYLALCAELSLRIT